MVIKTLFSMLPCFPTLSSTLTTNRIFLKDIRGKTLDGINRMHFRPVFIHHTLSRPIQYEYRGIEGSVPLWLPHGNIKLSSSEILSLHHFKFPFHSFWFSNSSFPCQRFVARWSTTPKHQQFTALFLILHGWLDNFPMEDNSEPYISSLHLWFYLQYLHNPEICKIWCM